MAEFNIRLFALNRMDLKEDLRTREIAYNSYVGGSIQLKKLPTKKQFWDLGITSINPDMADRIKREQEKHNNRHNGK